MTPDQLKRRLRESGFPEWEELSKLISTDETAFHLIAGVAVFNSRKNPAKLNRWAQAGNFGKITALGLFIIFLRRRGKDPDFTEAWTDFLESDLHAKRDICLRAWRYYKTQRMASEKDSDQAFHQLCQNDDFLEGLRNPRYLVYKSTRQLLSMLEQDGVHSRRYYVERTITQFFFPNERVTL